MQIEQPKPECPHCKFTVFSKRYAHCERCGTELPKHLVMSKEALSDLLASEREADAEAERLAKHQAFINPAAANHGSLFLDMNAGLGLGSHVNSCGSAVSGDC